MKITLATEYLKGLERSSIVVGPKGEVKRKLTQKEVQAYVREVLAEHRRSWERLEDNGE